MADNEESQEDIHYKYVICNIKCNLYSFLIFTLTFSFIFPSSLSVFPRKTPILSVVCHTVAVLWKIQGGRLSGGKPCHPYEEKKNSLMNKIHIYLPMYTSSNKDKIIFINGMVSQSNHFLSQKAMLLLASQVKQNRIHRIYNLSNTNQHLNKVLQLGELQFRVVVLFLSAYSRTGGFPLMRLMPYVCVRFVCVAYMDLCPVQFH